MNSFIVHFRDGVFIEVICKSWYVAQLSQDPQPLYNFKDDENNVIFSAPIEVVQYVRSKNAS